MERLLAGLDLFRDWRMACARHVRGPDHILDPNEFVEPGHRFLERFDRQPEHAQFWIKEVRKWYAVTASELKGLLKNGSPNDQMAVQAFLDDFKARLGFSLLAESGLLRSLATKVLRRGRVVSAEEYEDLTEILNDQSQSIISDGEARSLETILVAFEHRS
jgi:hypothetical protein